MALSEGQELALAQLLEIAARSDGALEVLGDPEEVEGQTYIRVQLSLATRAYRTTEGLAFRDRERLRLIIHDDFPFRPPWLFFAHKRFIGAPHVQWGSYICLYQSVEAEWQPSDGMFGLFDRIDQWFRAAGAGQLDPEDAPLHPPVAYTGSNITFVVKADTPAIEETSFWLGRAELQQIRDVRFDVLDWTAIGDWDDKPKKHSHIAAAILLSRALPLEFPSKIKDLYQALENAGVPVSLLIRLLRLVALMTEKGTSAHIVLGAPMRRKAAGEPLRPHLTVWEIDSEAIEKLRAYALENSESDEARDAVLEWMVTAKVAWCPVLEDRPEIVNRRDDRSIGASLRGKRVLLWGCGALGSAVAEQVVRAGAKAIGLFDSGIVKPGVLVRQRYADIDIGRGKAKALHDRLDALGLPCAITSEAINLRNGALAKFHIADWDLIVDATASKGVAHRIERELAGTQLRIPLATLTISAGAEYGSVAVKMPGYTGGPVQIARQAKLAAFQRNASHESVRAFWPKPEEIQVFQPEPGCSEPTFIGSAADLDFHAAALLNLALQRIGSLADEFSSTDFILAPWLPLKRRKQNPLRYEFVGYDAHAEQRHGFQVLHSEAAAKGIAAEIVRISRERSSRVETGGLMFGEIDDSHRYVWVDSVSGPPPDSEASPEKFICGVAGTVDLARAKSRASGGSSKFVGIWHTHPVSRGAPSEDDLRAMAQLLFLQPFPPRQVAMLIVGFAATRPELNFYLFHRHDFRVFVTPTQDEQQVTDA
ncbi:MAG: Mov34/MPN/PAD-1 family protein [Pseudomonadota bacterium]|nr:Mov34/MPN/PAD-1 family protein [Pseudomonadota bacterium]